MRTTGKRRKGTGYSVQCTVFGLWSMVYGLLFALLIAGCGGGGTPPVDPPPCKPSLDILINNAWSSYDSGKFSEALSSFTSGLTLCTDGTATPDQLARAYSGMGYSSFKLNDFTNAKASFTSSVQKSPSLTEAYAGLALVADALDDYTNMIVNALKVESLNAAFSFTHSPSIGIADMYVLAARGYLASNDICTFKKYYDKAKAADANNASVVRLTAFYNTYTYPQLSSCP